MNPESPPTPMCTEPCGTFSKEPRAPPPCRRARVRPPPKPASVEPEKLVSRIAAAVDTAPSGSWAPVFHRRVTLIDEERIARTTRHRPLPECRREAAHIGPARIRIVPVRQRPVARAPERGDRVLDRTFEVVQVDPVPREEEPAAMLALVPLRTARPLFAQGSMRRGSQRGAANTWDHRNRSRRAPAAPQSHVRTRGSSDARGRSRTRSTRPLERARCSRVPSARTVRAGATSPDPPRHRARSRGIAETPSSLVACSDRMRSPPPAGVVRCGADGRALPRRILGSHRRQTSTAPFRTGTPPSKC